MLRTILIVIVIALLVILGFMLFDGDNNQNTQNQENGDNVVATVNDEEFTRADLDARIELLRQNPQVQVPEEGGDDFAQFEELALNQLINDFLVAQEVERLGIIATEEEIDQQLQSLANQLGSQDALESRMEELGVTEESLRVDLRNQIVTNKYFNQLTEDADVSVSNEDVQAFYDEQVATQEDAPDFADVEAQIRATLEQQQTQQVVAESVEELRANAEIEILL